MTYYIIERFLTFNVLYINCYILQFHLAILFEIISFNPYTYFPLASIYFHIVLTLIIIQFFFVLPLNKTLPTVHNMYTVYLIPDKHYSTAGSVYVCKSAGMCTSALEFKRKDL